MHEDIDVSLHLLGRSMKTVYCQRMICGISARRMDTSFTSFRNYMNRFRNTFAAHPDHWRKRKPEHTLYALYPWMHTLYPMYQRYLDRMDINPAERLWLKEQFDVARRDEQDETDADADDQPESEGSTLTLAGSDQ